MGTRYTLAVGVDMLAYDKLGLWLCSWARKCFTCILQSATRGSNKHFPKLRQFYMRASFTFNKLLYKVYDDVIIFKTKERKE